MVASQENPEDVKRLSEGFYYSILSMLSVPALMLAILITVILRNNRSRRAATESPADGPLS